MINSNAQLNTPIAFVIFNRPDYTRQVFNAICAAKPKKLFVIADGPRATDEEAVCQEVRAIVEKIDWPCEVYRNYAEKNLGLKERFRSGLTWFFENVEAGIILEDDCLPHPSFFRFAEEMLEKYGNDERVMMISGDNFLPNLNVTTDSYFFSRYFPIWGWATWRRSWNKYDVNMRSWETQEKKNFIKEIYPNEPYMADHMKKIFDEILSGKLNTWDVQWLYICLISNTFCITPKLNLISNIGIVGTHSAGGDVHDRPTHDVYAGQFMHPTSVVHNAEYDHEYFEKNFRPIPQPFHKWLRSKTIAILVRSELLKKIYRLIFKKKK